MVLPSSASTENRVARQSSGATPRCTLMSSVKVASVRVEPAVRSRIAVADREVVVLQKEARVVLSAMPDSSGQHLVPERTLLDRAEPAPRAGLGPAQHRAGEALALLDGQAPDDVVAHAIVVAEFTAESET